ncbi:MAG: hypothetical protein ABI813_09690 [Bacteroidota bacterium]
MKRVLPGFLCCMFASGVFAQGDTTSHQPAPLKSYFSTTLGFLSNAVYNGRKDVSATPYITPMVGYYSKTGLFIDGSCSYLTKSGSSRIDLYNLEAGYDFYAGDFDGEVSAGKSFYNSNSNNVQSQIAGNITVSAGYDFTFIKPTIEGGINFGSQPDYLLGFGLEHSFYLLQDKLQFTPGAFANGSTLHYYGSYFNKRRIGGKKKNGGVVYDVTAGVDNPSRFNMLDYQFSLPVLYMMDKFSFSFTPVYVLPVNPALIVVQLKPQTGGDTITKTSAEIISHTFYFSLAVGYKF